MVLKRILTSFGFFLLTILLLNGAFRSDFERWDEQTNVEVVRDTIESSSLSLKLNNEDFFEKPPLFYYISIIISPITGIDHSGRFISVLSSFGIVVLIFLLLKKHLNSSKAITFLYLILLIPQLYFVNQAGYFASHTFSSFDLDALQIFSIVLSFFLLFISEKLSPKRIFLSYLSLSLGFLTKGPFVFIPLLINSFYIYKQRQIKAMVIGSLVFILPILFWIFLMYLNFGEIFVDNFVDYHILSRAITPLEGHNESPLFYLGILLDPRMNALGIPLILKLLSLRSFKNSFISKLFQYGLIFIFLSILLFTLAQTKLAWYILPVYPFIALLLAI